MTRYRGVRSIHARRAIAMFGATALAVGQLLTAAPSAQAGSFTAGSCSSTSTLIPFMEAANDESLNPGPDTIFLKAGCTYFIFGPIPAVQTDITIVGRGAAIELADDSTTASFFRVTAGASLILADVTLTEAVGSRDTGASIDNAGSTTLSGVTITHSVPFGQGGPGVYNRATGVMAMISSTIEHQSCADCDASGIRNAGNLTVTDSTFSLNTRRPAIKNVGIAKIFGSTFTSNTETAIDNSSGAVEVHGSSFVDNETGTIGGGAIDNSGASDLFVETSYFASNAVNGEGGAIYNGSEAIARVVNSTFFDNSSVNRSVPCCFGGTGGAIANYHSLLVEHVTFDRNAASNGASVASPEGIARIEGSVFGSGRGGGHCSGTVVDSGSNLTRFSDSSCPSTFSVGDAKLESPAVNGSGTKTMELGANSAAFDAVPSAGCPAYDQRGVARPVGAACDAGAFENQRPTVPGAPALQSSTSPNQGTFRIGWTAATDPDGAFPTHRLYRRDADDGHFTEIDSVLGIAVQRIDEPEGTFRYVVAADDGNLLSARSAESQPIVVDRTPPTAPSRSADRSPEGDPWFRDTVTVTFFGSTDPSLPDGSPGSGVASLTAPITRSTSGVFTLTGTATDAAGNVSSETTATVRVDAESPDVGFTSCPGDVALKSSVSVPWSASDASSGISGATSGAVALDTSTIGTRTASVTVRDLVGHESTATCPYRVIYAFGGFSAPLGNPPKLTEVKAGTLVPVVFSLGGDQGLGVLAAGFPQSGPISCTTPGELASGDATAATGPLEFQKAQGGRYRYPWASSKAWSGTCRQLIVALIDGTVHRANVRFK